MSFDYVSDLFGKFRKGKRTRFTELEENAKSLLRQFVNGKLSNKEFAKEFKGVARTFNELTTKGDQSVIDEDTPLWLNSLLGFHFIDWLRFQQVEQYFEEHPKELVGQTAATYEELKSRGYTEKFKQVCNYVLSELD